MRDLPAVTPWSNLDELNHELWVRRTQAYIEENYTTPNALMIRIAGRAELFQLQPSMWERFKHWVKVGLASPKTED